MEEPALDGTDKWALLQDRDSADNGYEKATMVLTKLVELVEAEGSLSISGAENRRRCSCI
jgi:hypothetical protein